MRIIVSVLAVVLVALPACSSSQGGGKSRQVRETEELGDLTPRSEDIPQEIKKIETFVESPSVILADEGEIYVSKNYQLEVSLTGDTVTPDIDPGGINERIATGNAQAVFRNLKIKCDRKLRLRIGDFGTQPFIRMAFKGHCSHIILGSGGGKHDVRRTDGILVQNAALRYVDNPTLSMPDIEPAAIRTIRKP